jgi:hypothetical protein
MMKKQIITLSFLFFSIVAMSQETDDQGLHFGLKASPSLAWFKTDTQGLESDGSKTGFIYGVIAEFKFAQRYAFATGIDVDYRGGKFKTVDHLKTISLEDSVVSQSASYNLQYIELPLTLKLKTNEIGSITYFMQIGVAPGIAIRARENYDATSQTTNAGTVSTTTASVDKVDILDDINNLNVSMILGAGIEYTLSGATVLLAGIQFSNGFTDVFDGDAKVNSNYLALNLGILF